MDRKLFREELVDLVETILSARDKKTRRMHKKSGIRVL